MECHHIRIHDWRLSGCTKYATRILGPEAHANTFIQVDPDPCYLQP